MYSSANNATIHKNPERGSIRSLETAISDDLSSCATKDSSQLEQRDNTNNIPVCDDEVKKGGSSTPADTARQVAKENPNIIDTSSENTSTTT